MQLETEEKNWYTQSYDDLLTGENGEEFCEFLDAIKNNIINEGKDKTVAELNKYIINNDSLIKDINEVMERVLFPYNACRIIPISKISSTQVKCLFEEIFQNRILRNDLNFFNSQEEYGISQEQIEGISDAFKFIAYKGVEGHLSKQSIKDLFEELSNLKGIYSEVFSELYNSNYKSLQINYLIDNIA